jgi:5-formyltetrahydrofolate cyclo-ligase
MLLAGAATGAGAPDVPGAMAAGAGAVDAGAADAGPAGGWTAAGAGWAATPAGVRSSTLEAASVAPANNVRELNKPIFKIDFISSMTGESRIPCGRDGLPDASQNVAQDKQVAAAQLAHAAKISLRKALRTARGGVDPAIKVQWDAHIGAQIVTWWRLRQLGLVGVYWPLAGEPDLRAAYAELVQAGVRLALPVVMERDAALTFAEWTPGEATRPDAAGVQVPARLRFVERPPALLVPCLGFTAEGYRLGYGGGYYDRTLAGTPRPYTLGIAYSSQEAVFSHASHDVPLDVIVTETTSVT